VLFLQIGDINYALCYDEDDPNLCGNDPAQEQVIAQAEAEDISLNEG
jgi:hypothetical protein